jgi:hypothetical protein
MIFTNEILEIWSIVWAPNFGYPSNFFEDEAIRPDACIREKKFGYSTLYEMLGRLTSE